MNTKDIQLLTKIHSRSLKMRNKLLAVFSIVSFIICLMAFPCFAASLPIEDCEDLQDIANNLSQDYHLINNIDCKRTRVLDDGRGFFPLGSFIDGGYAGTFEGNDFTIKNLYIVRSDSDSSYSYVGLFGYLNGAIVKNLTLENVRISGKFFTGGLAGLSNNGLLENVHVNGGSIRASIDGDEDASVPAIVGGLVGGNKNTDISNSSADVSIKGIGLVGGLIGYNFQSDITNSYSHSQMNGSTNWDDVSLITPSQIDWTEIASLENEVGLDWDEEISFGGVVGQSRESNVVNSYSQSTILELVNDATQNVINAGGIIGKNVNSSINKTYSTTLINWTDVDIIANAGGLIGWGTTYNIDDSFWDRELSSLDSSPGSPVENGKTNSQMLKQLTYENADWDFENNWDMCERVSHPEIVPGEVGLSCETFPPTQVTFSTKEQSDPAHAGKYIVWQDNQFRFERNDVSDVYLYDVTTMNGVRINNPDSDYFAPDISGNNIVYLNNKTGKYELYHYDMLTEEVTQLTDIGLMSVKCGVCSPYIFGDTVFVSLYTGLYLININEPFNLVEILDGRNTREERFFDGKVAFIETDFPDNTLSLYDMATNVVTPIEEDVYSRELAFNENMIMYAKDIGSNRYDIYLHNLNTNNSTVIAFNLRSPSLELVSSHFAIYKATSEPEMLYNIQTGETTELIVDGTVKDLFRGQLVFEKFEYIYGESDVNDPNVNIHYSELMPQPEMFLPMKTVNQGDHLEIEVYDIDGLLDQDQNGVPDESAFVVEYKGQNLSDLILYVGKDVNEVYKYRMNLPYAVPAANYSLDLIATNSKEEVNQIVQEITVFEGEQPSVEVTSLNNGGSFVYGDIENKISVSFESSLINTAYVVITLAGDDFHVISPVPMQDGEGSVEIEWNDFPSNYFPGDFYRAKVVGIDEFGVPYIDVSDQSFAVIPDPNQPFVSIISPNGGIGNGENSLHIPVEFEVTGDFNAAMVLLLGPNAAIPIGIINGSDLNEGEVLSYDIDLFNQPEILPGDDYRIFIYGLTADPDYGPAFGISERLSILDMFASPYGFAMPKSGDTYSIRDGLDIEFYTNGLSLQNDIEVYLVHEVDTETPLGSIDHNPSSELQLYNKSFYIPFFNRKGSYRLRLDLDQGSNTIRAHSMPFMIE